MKNDFFPKGREKNLVLQEIDDELLIYDLNKNKVFCLNKTSALIWQFCDGKRNIPEISKMLSKTYNHLVTDELVWLAIEKLSKENLLQNGNRIYANINSSSRRNLIKKAGLGSLIALPLISSVIAPSAINAQSGVVPQVCDNPNLNTIAFNFGAAPGMIATCGQSPGSCVTVNQIGCMSCMAVEQPSVPGGFCLNQGSQFIVQCVCT